MTIRTGVCRRSPSASMCARYSSTISSPAISHPDSARGVSATDGTAAIASAMRASKGGTICAPAPARMTSGSSVPLSTAASGASPRYTL